MGFVGHLGGVNSELGTIVLGYDPINEVVVTWIRNSHLDDHTQEIDFGRDDGGHPIILLPNVPTALTKDQARQARKDGAVLLVMGQI